MIKKMIFNICLTIGFFVFIVPQTVYAAAGDVWIYSSPNAVGTNSAFTIEVHVDTDTEKLATYHFSITFDPTLVNVDTSQGTDGVAAGTDGFITAVNPDNTNGTLQVIGLDTTGAGPGSNLQVLIIYFNSFSSTGQSAINLTVDALTNELGETIGTRNGIDGSITVNNPPANFDLVYPPDGQTDLPTSLPFIWKKTTDPDGDSLTYSLYYCTDPDVTSCPPVSVTSSTSHFENKGVLYGSMPGNWLILLVGLALIGGFKGKKEVRVGALIAMLMIGGALLPACGDNGGGNAEETPVSDSDDSDDSEATQPMPKSDEFGKTVSDLSTGTTYYWQVVAKDSNGGERDSEIRSFTTKS